MEKLIKMHFYFFRLNKKNNNIYFQILFLLKIAFVTCAHAQFTDITKAAGINHQFKVYEGMFGGGAAVFDYNNDGFEDVFITGGTNDDILYKNNGNGTFTNDYEKSGLIYSKKYVTQGVTTADINRDGFIDILITTITEKGKKLPVPRAPNLLFLNNGNGTFRDVTKAYSHQKFGCKYF